MYTDQNSHIDLPRNDLLRSVLGCNGAQQSPESVNLQSVQPVIDFGANGFGLIQKQSSWHNFNMSTPQPVNNYFNVPQAALVPGSVSAPNQIAMRLGTSYIVTHFKIIMYIPHTATASDRLTYQKNLLTVYFLIKAPAISYITFDHCDVKMDENIPYVYASISRPFIIPSGQAFGIQVAGNAVTGDLGCNSIVLSAQATMSFFGRAYVCEQGSIAPSAAL